MAKKYLQELLERPMTRKEFLRNIGLLILAAFGVTKFIDHLLKNDFTQPKKVSSTTRWGGGKFGV
jgi:hypothetical protein